MIEDDDDDVIEAPDLSKTLQDSEAKEDDAGNPEDNQKKDDPVVDAEDDKEEDESVAKDHKDDDVEDAGKSTALKASPSPNSEGAMTQSSSQNALQSQVQGETYDDSSSDEDAQTTTDPKKSGAAPQAPPSHDAGAQGKEAAGANEQVLEALKLM